MKKLLNQEVYQGTGKEKNYFEGWYYKNVTSDGRYVISLIPGICINESDSHAFIQIIENKNNKTYYIRYPVEEFKYDKDKLKVTIGSNVFEKDKIDLKIKEKDITLKGTLTFRNHTHLTKTAYRPNIMGPFAYLNKMECNHGIVSLHHDINGNLKINNTRINFNKGSGYIEKDYGSSFPKKYMWISSNSSVKKDKTSFMFSYATIPLAIINFNGLISVLNTNDKQYVFASYYGARVKYIKRLGNKTSIEIKQNSHTLSIECIYKEGLILAAPKSGEMAHKINEHLDCNLKVKLYDKDNLLYENDFIQAGYEDVGKLK